VSALHVTYRRMCRTVALVALACSLLGPLSVHGQGRRDVLQVVSPEENSVSMLHSQAVIVRAPAGSAVELYVNGRFMKSDIARIDGVVDFLNIEVPAGDVNFDIRMPHADSTVNGSVNRRIHILGPPAILAIETEADTLAGDGLSIVRGSAKVFDEWNYPYSDGLTVSVDADSGKLLAQDEDPSERGAQIRLENGEAKFTYQSGTGPWTAVIRAQADKARGSREIKLTIPPEEFTLVGLASGTGVSSAAHGDRSRLSSEREFPDGFTSDGRIAMYARGTVFGGYHLTASFDSDRKDRSRLFRDLDPDYLYSMYGDNSLLTYDAQSARQLYVRLENDKNFLYYGDYNTNFAPQEFTLYSRTLNGMQFRHQNNGWKVATFGSLTDRKVVQVELRGTGLSGLYSVGYLHITPGSDKVRVETRDRFHSEVILRQNDLYRFADYEIDNDQGTLFFKQPVPSIDQDGNPVFIVVTFEAITDGENAYIAGGRVERTLGENLSVGVNGVVEEQSPTNYTLLGGDLKYDLKDRFTLLGEIGRSNTISGQGLAYKVESSLRPVSELSLKGYYRRVENGFYNVTQSGSGRELGTKKYGASGAYQPGALTKFVSDFYRSEQDGAFGKVTLRSVSGGIEQGLGADLLTTLRVEDITYDGQGPDTARGAVATHSTLGTARLAYTLSDRLKLSAQHERNFGSDQDITKPNATALAAEFKLADPVSLQGQQKFYEGGGSLSSLGLTATPFEGTTAYGKYEIGNAIGQRRNMISIGLRNILKLPWDLTANLGYERAKSLERRLGELPTEDHVAYSGSLEYLPERPIKLAAKAEYGENSATKRTNLTFGGDYRIGNDFSLLAKHLYAKDDAVATASYQTRHHLITGLAFRPVAVNWLNLVAKYELKQDNNHYLTPFDEYGASIVSAHAYLEPVRRIELGLKYAFRTAREYSPAFSARTHTHFYLASLRYDITDAFDLGGEYRLLWQTEARDLLNGYSLEAGYAFAKDLRLSGGYNFKGYKDRDLVDYRLWSQGPYVRVDVKFDEALFGLNPR